MYDEFVFSLTPEGEKELRGGSTTVRPAELDLLVRIDGKLTFGQIKAGMGAAAAGDVDATLSRLINMELVRRGAADPFAGQFDFRPSDLAVLQATSQADAATASLQKSGYFVRIANKRPARIVPPGQKLTAIIVEDDPHLAKFLQHYLTFDGFEVRVAGNRAEAVAALTTRPVADLVLLDVMLPDVDGFDILFRLRQHPVLGEVPVIMMTAKATRESVIRGLAGGADGYVTKPFEAEALLDAVRAVTGLAAGGLPGRLV